MNVLSCFDGMSCGRIALERLGIKVDNYYASEIDKHAIKVTMANYPDTIQLGDIRNIHGKDLPKIDLVLAGSPCQGFSVAGKGLNFDDPRSALLFEFLRLLAEVRAINQDVKFLLENVRMKKSWENRITRLIGIEPIIINSALVSAQNRVRLYWTDIRTEAQGLFDFIRCNIPQPKDRGIILRNILETDVDEKYYLSEVAIARIKRKDNFRPRIDSDKTGTINTKNNSGQLSVDQGTTLIKEKARTLQVGGHGSGNHSQMDVIQIAGVINNNCFKASKASKASNLDSNYHKGLDDHGQRTVIQMNQSDEYGTYPRQQNRVYNPEGLSPALLSDMSSKSHAIVCHNKQPRSGNPNKGGTGPLKRDDWKTYSLDTQQVNQIEYAQRYRRLTPTECERLQGVPDGYTAHVSDTQRYKMLGNGWQVDTIVHILSYYGR